MFESTIGRGGAIPPMEPFLPNSTVQDLLNRFGMVVGDTERIYAPNASVVSPTDALMNGTYAISKQQENGLK